MTREDVLARDPGGALGGQFPDVLEWRDMRFKLSYAFEPGGATDGVSVTVPVALLNRVPRYRFDWLVPVFGSSVVVLSADATLGTETHPIGDLATAPVTAVSPVGTAPSRTSRRPGSGASTSRSGRCGP